MPYRGHRLRRLSDGMHRPLSSRRVDEDSSDHCNAQLCAPRADEAQADCFIRTAGCGISSGTSKTSPSGSSSGSLGIGGAMRIGWKVRSRTAGGGLPAHLPPPSSNRDHIPLVVWKELPPLLILSSKETSRANRPVFNEPTRTPPHVRLMVLFCSFLN